MKSSCSSLYQETSSNTSLACSGFNFVNDVCYLCLGNIFATFLTANIIFGSTCVLQ